MEWLTLLRDGALTAAGGAVVAGAIVTVRQMLSVSRDVKSFGPSIQALYRVQPHVLNALQYQNAALRDIGANGSSIKADEAICEARKALDNQLTERVGNCT